MRINMTESMTQRRDLALRLFAKWQSEYRTVKNSWQEHHLTSAECRERYEMWQTVVEYLDSQLGTDTDFDEVIMCDATEEYTTNASNDGFRYVEVEDAWFSESYFSENFGTCESSGEICRLDDLYEVYRLSRYGQIVSMQVCEYVRDEDYIYCDWDSEYWLYEDTVETAHGDRIPRIAIGQGYETCGECGDIYHERDIMWNDHSEQYECAHCYSEPSSDDYEIYNWSYKPSARFLSLVSNDEAKYFYGLEIESDRAEHISPYAVNRSDGAEAVYDALGDDVYIKEDGSLTSNGFEIVTHPMSYKYIMEHKQNFADAFTGLIKAGMRGHDACKDEDGIHRAGLHIHVSRAAFGTQEAQDRFVYLFEKFYEQVVVFTRRQRSSIQRWAKRYDFYNEQDTTVEFADKLKNEYPTKYRLVNRSHPHTLEVRAFRGTHNVDTLIASVQFMEVMVELANKSDKVSDNIVWQSVVKLAKLRNFTELNDYLVKRNLDTVKTYRVKRVVKQKLVFTPKVTKATIIGNNKQVCQHYFPIGSTVMIHSIRADHAICTLVDLNGHEDSLAYHRGSDSQHIVLEDLQFEGTDLPASSFQIVHQ